MKTLISLSLSFLISECNVDTKQNFTFVWRNKKNVCKKQTNKKFSYSSVFSERGLIIRVKAE